jgi:hypothetical protein
LPEYPDDAVPHHGLLLFRENRLLFNEKTASERDKQTIALLIAKQFSEFVKLTLPIAHFIFEMFIFLKSGLVIWLLLVGGMSFGFKRVLVIITNIK